MAYRVSEAVYRPEARTSPCSSDKRDIDYAPVGFAGAIRTGLLTKTPPERENLIVLAIGTGIAPPTALALGSPALSSRHADETGTPQTLAIPRENERTPRPLGGGVRR